MPPQMRQFSPEGAPALPSHSVRCSIHGNPSKMPRNLVVCIDGTANKFGRNNTNVVKLFEAVDCDSKDPSPEQYTYYLSGIGTRPRVVRRFKRMKKAIVDKLDMAIAWNMEEIVKDAYGWIAGKYQEGDQIYLFGFSRGAYQVRVLAWMIYEVGLIKNPTERQIGSAYDHFESIMSHRPNASDIARDFRKMFSWKDLRVHFIGVWDTVSSVGFGRGDVRLSVSSTAAHACHIRHALALDELRVKFMPEYFLEMNSPDLRRSSEEGSDNVKGDDSNSGRVQGSEAPNNGVDASGPREPLPSDDDIVLERRNDIVAESEEIQPEAISCRNGGDEKCADRKAAVIKEVWFAGSHSDVGGEHRPGKSSHAGKVSLMWMYREASTSGLILKPEDIFWTDEDLDFGTTSSMSPLWKLVEFLPLQHQVSFSGSGENARRLHLFKPRRIIPGQKIHASVRFSRTYMPKATFGNGFGIPWETATFTETQEDDIWEDAIDRTTYAAIFDNLKDKQETEEYLHRLLFLQRFSNSQWPVEELSNRQKILTDLITKKSGLVRLAAIAAYAEAADYLKLDMTLSLADDVLEEARKSLVDLLTSQRRGWQRAVGLLLPIARHENLRNLILTDGVVDSFLQLLDRNIRAPEEYFSRIMDALSSLLKLDPKLIKRFVKLGGEEQKDRLLLMLNTNDSRYLVSVLRVIVSLAEQAPDLCFEAEPRLRELARKHPGTIGLLALKALARIVASRCDRQGVSAGPDHASNRTWVPHIINHRRAGDYFLYRMFSARSRGSNHGEVVKTVLNAAGRRDTRTRTAATLTLLRLRQANPHMKDHLSNEHLLDLFVKQLQFKNSALLAAHALTECLADEELGELVDENHDLIAERIINMIMLDYFDEAIGIVEGFTIFDDLMKRSVLRHKVLGYDITTLLARKLGTGKPREMRTGLIYLSIFRIHGEQWLIKTLMDQGVSFLETNQWETQKPGVAILCSLAQTGFGAEALKPILPKILNMLLPTHNQQNTKPSSSNGSKSVSALLGPAFVICVLAENELLRIEIRNTKQYGEIKHHWLFGDLLDAKETPVWRIKTPTRDDVLDVISQMIKSVDSVEGSTETGFILPHIHHWGRLVHLVRNVLVSIIVTPPAVAAVAALTVVGAVVAAPVVAYHKVVEFTGHPWQFRRQNAFIRSLKRSNPTPPAPTIPLVNVPSQLVFPSFSELAVASPERGHARRLTLSSTNAALRLATSAPAGAAGTTPTSATVPPPRPDSLASPPQPAATVQRFSGINLDGQEYYFVDPDTASFESISV